MKNILIAITLMSTLSSCAITPTSPEQYPRTYSVEGKVTGSKHFILMQRPGDPHSYTMLESKRPIQQPLISTNGKFITYISFERTIPALFIQEAATGRRVMVCFLEDQAIQTQITQDSSKLMISSKGSNYGILLVEPSLLDHTLPRESLPFCSPKIPSEI